MNQGLDKLAEIIESREFRLVANQAAGLLTFKRLVEQHEVFTDIIKFASDKQGALQLLGRILELSSKENDQRYENPYDTALATYLLALDATNSEYSVPAAYLTRSASQLWWSVRISTDIIARSKQKVQSETAQQTVGQPPHIDLKSAAGNVSMFVFQVLKTTHTSKNFVYFERVSSPEAGTHLTQFEGIR
jgi:hypothetical protein